jgi:hypothetical protein
MSEKINHNFQNNRGNFSILIEEKERVIADCPDIRIKFSIQIINTSNNDWIVNIGDVICYIDKCEGEELTRKEEFIKSNLIDAIEKIIDLDTPGNHYLTSDSLDFRSKK